eukprot:1355981-Amphidinium_carterae.3
MVLESLASTIRHLLRWCEMCPCHEHMFAKLAPLEHVDKKLFLAVTELWYRCPLRGCRSPELSSGTLIAEANRLLDTKLLELDSVLTPRLAGEPREACLAAFLAGRSHLLFYLTFKLAHWQEAPWLVCKLALSEEVLARDAYTRLITMPQTHTRVRKLLEEPLLSQGQLWHSGVSLFDDKVRDFCEYVAELRFSPCAERRIEGQHRVIKQRGVSAPNHSTAYMSFGLRKHELCHVLENEPGSLLQLADLAVQVRTRPLAMKRLGLLHHPHHPQHAGTTSKRMSSSLLAKLIYHADPATLYGRSNLTAVPRPKTFAQTPLPPAVLLEPAKWKKRLLVEHLRHLLDADNSSIKSKGLFAFPWPEKATVFLTDALAQQITADTTLPEGYVDEALDLLNASAVKPSNLAAEFLNQDTL